ncbi:formate dehydrogenase accessory sulfurtransferase FdhD [Clostridium sp. A1-XYC3]|uniref:Sulfur carrier protein FdhD n=1 Tax=Clostridium tanneri TaxID=3037988 RepID=A0ABU4JPJ8_9CLOT|nr:formate dehydrogenase accessory sulfurtransferase FdhD [Clostridium sp. A1-XYC3]MDW8799881.1 formate dehydrogenase accessory sulfurtransferase FdhD [Clostridium sp. A1-XYC3]
MNKTIKYSVVKYDRTETETVEEIMIYEYPLSIILSDTHITTLTCTPENLKALVVGYLRTQGIIDSMEDIKTLEIDEKSGIARVNINSNMDKKPCRQVLPVGFNENNEKEFFQKLIRDLNCKVVKDNNITIGIEKIYHLMKENLSYSEAFKQTGGAHSIALCDKEKVLFICEDVARHNAVDKVMGEALIRNISLEDKILLISGRVSFEMVLKTSKSGIPIVVSKSAPTNLSIELSNALNITLIGFVRGEKANIYTNSYRVTEKN